MTNSERNRLESEFRQYIERYIPNIDDYWFCWLMDSFQRGLMKGEALMYNKLSNGPIKLCVFNDDWLEDKKR